MRYRCEEGNGEAYYYIGLYDDGRVNGITEKEFDETFENLKLAADKNKYSIILENVEIYDEDGDIVATTTVNEDKTWNIDITSLEATPKNDNEFFKVSEVDSSNNESDISDAIHFNAYITYIIFLVAL